MEKPFNNRAWFMVLPVFIIVAFSAILPLMTVVNYSVQDILLMKLVKKIQLKFLTGGTIQH
jgi:ABC-type sugar transport system permease subunit